MNSESQPLLPGIPPEQPQGEENFLKRYWICFLLIGFVLIVNLVFCFTQKVSESFNAVIEQNNGEYYFAKIINVKKNSFEILRYSDKSFKKKKSSDLALEKPVKETIELSQVKNLEILSINLDSILKKADVKDKTEENVPLVPKEYLGYYNVQVSGHKGLLFLGISKRNKLVGSIRFPKWAKGVWERLKGVRISGAKLFFIRSVSNETERRRIGAPHYFKQIYEAEFFEKGKRIWGTYSTGREHTSWEAFKR